MSLGIGSTVYVFDGNRREYCEDENGRRIGGPIWIKHWVPAEIVGENRASWKLSRFGAFPKKGQRHTYPKGGYMGHRVALSWDDVIDAEWANEHRYHIVRQIEGIDAAILRKVAELISYDEGNKL